MAGRWRVIAGWVWLVAAWLGAGSALGSSLPLLSYQADVSSQQLAEDAERRLGQISGLFAALGVMLEQPSPEAERHRILKRMLEAVPHVRAVLVVDRDGRVQLDSATYPASRLMVADREYFRQALVSSPLSLWVGSMVVGRSSSLPFIPVSSRLSDRDGGMVAVAVITPDELIDPRLRCPLCSAALVRSDGRVISGVPYGYHPTAELIGAMHSSGVKPPLVTRVGNMSAVSFWRKVQNNDVMVVYSVLLHD